MVSARERGGERNNSNNNGNINKKKTWAQVAEVRSERERDIPQRKFKSKKKSVKCLARDKNKTKKKHLPNATGLCPLCSPRRRTEQLYSHF